jgi:hypothetical protein
VELVERVVPAGSGAAITTAPQVSPWRSRPEPGANVGAGGPSAAPRQWRVRCQDVASRERFVTVFVEHGRVVLVGPPGESAVLSPGQLSQLRSALQEAADEAER